jgi:hypothetical protein
MFPATQTRFAQAAAAARLMAMYAIAVALVVSGVPSANWAGKRHQIPTAMM